RTEVADALRSSIETTHDTAKASGTETSAGLSYGNGAAPSFRVAVHTPGLSATSPTDEIRPASDPLTAPLVVRSGQTIDNRMTGKLALAAIAKTSPTMNAIFWFSKTTPNAIARRLMATAASF